MHGDTMDEYKLTRKLQRGASEVRAKTRFCPDEDLLVQYFEGNLTDDRRPAIERHVVDCRYCQAQLGNLAQVADTAEDPHVAGTTLARAKALAITSQSAGIRRAPVWAAAAVLLLTLSTAMLMSPRQAGDSPDLSTPQPAAPTEPRELRNLDPTPDVPAILSPADGVSLQPAGLTIRWTGVPGTLHYEVRVIDTEGYIVWNGRTESTEMQPPLNGLLESGASYFVRVDAYLTEANSAGSEHVLFTVKGAEE